MADPSTDRDHQFLLTSLEQIRTRLLDKTRRNRLLNYKESARDIAVIDEMPDQVYEHLVLEGRQFHFDPYEDNDDDESNYAPEDPSRTLPSSAHRGAGVDARYTDSRLQTPFNRRDLERRLRRLYLNHKTIIEETGANNLYLAMGFLEWMDRNDDTKVQRSPLMLVPVRLEREGRAGAAVYPLVFDDEALDTNYSLYEKLKHSFDITLPLLEDEQTPEGYWSDVERAVQHNARDGWRIVREMSIGLFRFQKQVVWHDLDPSRWPAHSSLTDKPLIRRILLGAKADESRPGQLIEEYNQDDPDNGDGLRKIRLIRDADSSQYSALVDALERQDGLVIEGPPGTGKSQTITNLIAAVLAEGKSVLFVAEKMAALEVVHKRLVESQLGDFCLQLHGLKTGKKELLDSIGSRRRRRASRPRELERKEAEIADTRADLIKLSTVLSEPIGPEALPLYEIAWRVERLRQKLPEGFRPVHIEAPASLSQSAFDRATHLVADLGREWEAIPDDARAAWAGCRPQNYSDTDQEDVSRCLANAISGIREIRDWLEVQGLSNAAPSLRGLRQLRALAGQAPEELLPPLPPGAAQTLVHDAIHTRQIDGLAELLPEIDRYFEDVAAINEVFDFAAEDSDRYASELKQHSLTLSGVICEPETSIGNLSDNLLELEATIEKLKSLDAASRPILDITGGFARSIDDHKTLTERVERLTSGPKDLTFHATPAHALKAARRYFEEAQLQSQALADSATPLVAFALDREIDPKAVREALGAIQSNLGSWFPILSSAYRKAKKHVRMFMKRPSDYSRGPHFISQLEALPEHLENVERFNANNDFSQALGSLFSGVSTEWKRLDDVLSFSEKLREELGLEIAQSILADWNGHVERIEMAREEIERALKTISDFRDSHPLPNTLWQRPVSEIAGTLAPWSPKLTRAIESISQPWCSSAASLSRALETVERYRHARSLEGEIEQHRGFGVIRPHWSLSHTPISQLHEAYEWLNQRLSNPALDIDLLQALVPEPSTLNRGLLTNLVDQCSRFVECLEDQIRSLEKIGPIEDYVWTGGADASLSQAIAKQEACLATATSLPLMVRWQIIHAQVCEIGLEAISKSVAYGEVNGCQAPDAFEYSVYLKLLSERVAEEHVLASFGHERIESLRERFSDLDRELFDLTAASIAAHLCGASIPEGVSYGRVSEKTEGSLLRHEEGKKRRHIPVRQLVRRAGNALQALKPCFLMSPLSVAQFLAPGEIEFDFVVMDEASQIRPEDALGAIARARRAIIVGDPKQLPPTSFFDTAVAEDNEAEETIVEDTESILDVCLKQFPFRRLRWHYRSQHEDLIRFSNDQFYDNDLIVFPSPKGSSREFGVHSTLIDAPSYKTGRNLAEARVVVDRVIQQLRAHPDTSLGVAAFNKRQAEEIQLLLDKAAREDPSIDELISNLDDEYPLFIKNLENVQGDERDVIFISTTYGPEGAGAPVHQRFGPINSDTGWRRLNVIATRARQRVEVITSLRPTDVLVGDNARRGVRALRDYLEYAVTGQVSDLGRRTSGGFESDFEVAVGAIVEQLGYQVEPQVGVEGFFIDIGVCHPDRPGEYLMGIECDGASYHSSRSVRDRDRLRQEILEDKGWCIHRIWSTSWFHTRASEIDRLNRAILHQLEADRAITRARPEAPAIQPQPAFIDETELEVEEAESLSDALERFWSQNIEPDFPNRSRSILSAGMIELLIQNRPSCETDWFTSIPIEMRQQLEPKEREFLVDILDVIAECG